jgi:beta-galactosidase/beta-glucuronidase
MRSEWLNLNGDWEFEEDPGRSREPRGLQSGRPLRKRIRVPFCPESELSGVGNTDFMPAVWYRRMFGAPSSWGGDRVLLHFGAVDYEATVWLNGRCLGAHEGGYTPFVFDATDHLRAGENELVVRAVDDTRDPLQPVGKQSERYESYGCHYTRTTGIWQTVWLEAVPHAHIVKARCWPDLRGGRLFLEVSVAAAASGLSVEATVRSGGDEVGAASAVAHDGAALLAIELGEVRAWSPGDPALYELDLVLADRKDVVDRVETYFGVRSIALRPPAICLNGEPVFQRMVLDQGYYPGGVYTAPSDEALRTDIELAKAMGFNGARLHQKVFEPRFLYWADRLGYLVWAEYPSWGLDVTQSAALSAMLPEWLEVVERDINHPSIVGWCPFNETPSAQQRAVVRSVYRATKAVDPTRPVIDSSGYVHVETDVDDFHCYEQDPEQFAAQFRAFAEGGPPPHRSEQDSSHRGQPYFVSEYGGIWWNPGQSDAASWGYGERPANEREFLQRYRRLTETLLFHPRMCGFCYTQLYDVQQEVNGLYTYGRRAKFDPAAIRRINEQKAAIET